ncbi:MAG: NlpC/P60 family protein [Faecalimonas sp.]|nr:NlpC/P60 family protein [Faecalimonas sp.]
MQLWIYRDTKKLMLATLALLFGFFLASGQEIVAKILPNASELKLVSCELSQTEYEYTGKEAKPEVLRATFTDAQGHTIVKEKDELRVVGYLDNQEPGSADVKLAVQDYLGTITLDDVFYIYPAKVKHVRITEASQGAVCLAWEKMEQVDGYFLYKRQGTDGEYVLVQEFIDEEVTSYQDTEISLNQVYHYKLSAFIQTEKKCLEGEHSDSVQHYTPLSTPVITDVSNQAYNSLQISWEAVAGAVGYQLYKGNAADGEFICIAEIADGAVTSYVDSSCECGIPYFYYVKAAQQLPTELVYGPASNVASGKTTPNTVRISGNLTGGNTQVNLSWKPAAGAQGYEIYKSEWNGAYQLVARLEDANALSWSETDVNKSAEYRYRVKAYCMVDGQALSSGYSNTYVKDAIYEYNYTPGELSANMQKILEFAGTPYVFGGKTPKGWDCSGFTKWVMEHCMGVILPKSAAEQGAGGRPIDKNNRAAWKPGDIITYNENGGAVSHVAIYIGDGKLIHALSAKYDTLIQDVDYYERWDTGTRMVGVRRYFD